MTSQSAQYRPEIDGLRAIAVLSVMLFHAKIIPFRGGFVGVDIFFVISGFLITQLIVEAHAQGRWSFIGFWFNRARRLLPPLFIVAMASFTFGWLWLSPSAFKTFGIQLAAGLGFLSNIYFLRSGADYFQLPDDQLPFLHLWSLSVEEQFYLFFPFILFACLRWSVSIRKVLILLCLASFGLSVALTITWPTANFYLLPTRAWELLAGAIAATIAWPKVKHQASVVLLGLALIIGPILFYTKALAFPGAWALPPVIGTVLVLGYGQSGGGAPRLLAARPMVGVGLISYAAYLWHQPLLVFGQSISLAWSNWHAAAAVLLSLILAGASYVLIERPSRGWAAHYPKRFGAACLLIFTLLMGSAVTVYRASGVPSRMPASVQKIEAQKTVMSEQLTRCLFLKDGTPPAQGPCLKGQTGPVRIAILGDSHAAALAPAFDQNLSGQGVRAIQLTLPGCLPILEGKTKKGPRGECRAFMRSALFALAKSKTIKTIVISGRWTAPIEPLAFDNGEGGREGTAFSIRPDVPAPQSITERLQGGIDILTKAGKIVILVYPVPEAGWSVPDRLLKLAKRGQTDGQMITTSRRVFDQRNARSTAMLDAIKDYPGLIRFDPARALCAFERGTRCLNADQGGSLYFDADHISDYGARTAWPKAVWLEIMADR